MFVSWRKLVPLLLTISIPFAGLAVSNAKTFSSHEVRIGTVEKRLNSIDKKIDQILDKLHLLDKKIDRVIESKN